MPQYLFGSAKCCTIASDEAAVIKTLILIMTNDSKKDCLKVMKKEQVVDQKLSQLADFPLLCTHSGKF